LFEKRKVQTFAHDVIKYYGRPGKRKRALEHQPGEMPSPEKVSKAEENDDGTDDEDIFEDTVEGLL
jgi:hypothetical protein